MSETLPARAKPEIVELVEQSLRAKASLTAKTYATDYRAFAAWRGAKDPAAALQDLLRDQGRANRIAAAYRAHLLTVPRGARTGYAPATVNRRIQALRSFVNAARLFGYVEWSLSVEAVSSQAYRDTQGPGSDGVAAMLRVVEADLGDPKKRAKALRDRAIIRLLFDNALRRAELLGLRYPEHIDVRWKRISILGKKRTEREWLTLAPRTLSAIREWLEARGRARGPLFCSLDRRALKRKEMWGLTGQGVWKIIGSIGRRAEIRISEDQEGRVTPHGLRHAAITAALDKTGGDVRRVARFSRHKDPRTVQIYDDTRKDDHGEIAKDISEDV